MIIPIFLRWAGKPMHTKEITPQSTIVKSNESIDLLRKYTLSELRLLAFCLAHFDSMIDDSRTFTTHVSNLLSVFPTMDEKSAYSVVSQLVITINSKPAIYEDEEKEGMIFWFSELSYYKRTGEFSFKLSEEIKPYLTELKEQFTIIKIKDVQNFKRAATWKLYEYLVKNKYVKRWTVELDELRFKLGIAGKYKTWSVLKRDVIDIAVNEINEKSDLQVRYEEGQKNRKRILSITFFIDKNVDDDVITVASCEDEIYKILTQCGVNAKTANDYTIYIHKIEKSEYILGRLPNIIDSAKTAKQSRNIPIPKYVLGAIKSELNQLSLLDIQSSNNSQQSRRTASVRPLTTEQKYGRFQQWSDIKVVILRELTEKYEGKPDHDASAEMSLWIEPLEAFMKNDQEILLKCTDRYFMAFVQENFLDIIKNAIFFSCNVRYKISFIID